MKNIVYSRNGIWSFRKMGHEIRCFNPVINATEIVCVCDNDAFDVTICENDNIYVLYQKGNNLYISGYNGQWHRECILEGKKEQYFNNGLKLFSSGNILNVFYVLEHNGKYLMVYQLPLSNISPYVIYSSDTPFVFSITFDLYKNIYCVIADDGRVFYFKYIWNKKQWEKENIICENLQQVSSAFAFSCEDKIFVAVCTCDGGSYSVIIDGRFEIASGLKKEVEPCIINHKNGYSCVFGYYGKLLESRLSEKGWERIRYLHSDGFEKTSKVKISSVTDFGRTGIRSFYWYGACLENNEYKFPLLDDDYSNNVLEKISENKPESVVELAGERIKEHKDISEEISSIKRTLENDGTAMILTELDKKLSNMETILMKIAMSVEAFSEANDQKQNEKSP